VTAGAVATLLLLTSLISNIRFFSNVRRRLDLTKDTNAVELFEVSASQVLDLEALGDNAPAFCFFVGEGKALLLVGQWLLPYDPFPAKSFRIRRWADNKKPIRIEITGESLPAANSTVRLRPGHRFGKIELFDARPETLQDDLDRALGARKR
jgi:hypothetical protein